jgi:hypothetical protein
MDAEVRDAVEADAESMAAIADAPEDVMRNVLHDRTVRVAVRPRTDAGPNADTDADDRELLGFVSFDVRGSTVYVTQLGGSVEACELLLAEPVRFARGEDFDVEYVASKSDDRAREAVDRAGFENLGPGPQFEGEATVRYRLDPN